MTSISSSWADMAEEDHNLHLDEMQEVKIELADNFQEVISKPKKKIT